MKVSDIMLDLATGDASQYDAYIQEAVGQVRVSAAYFDAGMGIASLSDSDREQIVQESAFVESGLPSEKEDAIDLVYEAVQRELTGTCRHLYMEAAKIAERADKATSPYCAMNAIGKSCGVEHPFDGSLDYVMEYADSTVSDKEEGKDVAEGRFLTASAAKAYTKAVVKAMCSMATAFGIDCCELCENETVKKVVGKMNCKVSENITLDSIASDLNDAYDKVKDTKLSEDAYTTKQTKANEATVKACDFALSATGKFLKKKFGEDNGKCEAVIKKAIKEKKNKKSVDGDSADLNAKSDAGKSKILDLNKKLADTIKDLIAGFNDSIATAVTAKASK